MQITKYFRGSASQPDSLDTKDLASGVVEDIENLTCVPIHYRYPAFSVPAKIEWSLSGTNAGGWGCLCTFSDVPPRCRSTQTDPRPAAKLTEPYPVQ